jgi:hypothetical protein
MSAVTPKAEVNSGNLVERFFNKIKQYQRVATRYDKFAAYYLAFIKLASIRIWLDAAKRQPGTPAIRRAGVPHDPLTAGRGARAS